MTQVLNVLADRYASPELVRIWGPEHRVVVERRIWLAVLEAQRAAGMDVAEAALADYRAVVDRVDLDAIRERERRTRHDVMARIEEFDVLAGHQLVHAGLTSRDATENVEQHLVLATLDHLRRRTLAVLSRLADRAEEWRAVPVVARTHNVPAQVTTVGKRLATLAEELLFGLERLDQLRTGYPVRGLKGAVGTQQDLLDLVGEDGVVTAERAVLEAVGGPAAFDAVGQVYPRSVDFAVVATWVQLASAPANLALLLRLMAGHDLATEGFRPGQVGSSAMPHKMNPRSSERVTALTTVLKGHLTMAAGLVGEQWNEGDVSCSAVRRVVLPDAAYALDGILGTTIGVLDEMGVHRAVLEAELDRYLPFLATGRFLATAVRAGVGREDAHAWIKDHAVGAALALHEGRGDGGPDLVRRIVDDERLPLSVADVEALLAEPAVGRVDRQISAVVERVRAVVATDPEAVSASAQPAV